MYNAAFPLASLTELTRINLRLTLSIKMEMMDQFSLVDNFKNKFPQHAIRDLKNTGKEISELEMQAYSRTHLSLERSQKTRW